jgi:molecular chaperone DnaK
MLIGEFQFEHQVDLRSDRMALQRLKEAAEKAKHELSSSLETQVNLPFIAVGADGGPLHLERSLPRNELEMLTGDLVDRTIEVSRDVLRDARLAPSEIQTVVLVGGMTRMPAIQAAVKQLFGRDPCKGANPDEVVAVGAALQAAALSGKADEILLLDVTPLSLGVETGGGVMTKLITRNTTIPTSRGEVFTTSLDRQTFVPIHVLQGEREMAEDCQSLARFELSGIPPAPRGVPKIQVVFNIDEDGLVHVEAKDLGTGRVQKVRVTPTSGLAPAEVERLVTEAEKFKETDAERRDMAELRNLAETLLYTTEEAIEGYAELVDEKLRESIREGCKTLRTLVEDGARTDDIRAAYMTLEAAAFHMSEVIYGGTASTA